MGEINFSQVSEFLAQCKKELDGWFGIDLPMPELMVLKSAQDVAEIWDSPLGENLPMAWADVERDKLYVLQMEEVAKLQPRISYDFWTLLKHEYAHFYWYALTRTHLPIWMDEGLACYLAGEKLALRNKELVLNIREYFNKKTFDTYAVGYVGVKYLIEKFGKDKFVEFLSKLSEIVVPTIKKMSAEAFEGLFKQYFGFGLSREELEKVVRENWS